MAERNATFENPYAPPTAEPPVETTGIAHESELASLNRRLVGAILDTVFMLVSANAVGVPLRNTLAQAAGSEVTPELKLWTFWIGLAVFMVVQCALLAWRQQSLGKILCRTKIVNVSGGRAGIVQTVLLRHIPFFLGWLLGFARHYGLPWWSVQLFPLADPLAIYYGSDRRCIHDYLAGTKVVMVVSSRSREGTGA